ncbi:MAG TPA: S-layer homology domain-containing protein [Anaerolineales bacterium]
MKLVRARKPVAKLSSVFLSLCVLLSSTALIPAAQASPLDNLVESGCSVIYNGGNGWVIDLCSTDSSVPASMEIWLNGVSRGNAALVRIYHQSQSGLGIPQVAVIYASGFVRLKQNADPSRAIPFGTSFILGPAYWPGSSTYYHNPQLHRLEIDTSWLPTAPLRMRAEGANHGFDVTYEMALPPPRDRQTRVHVTQTYTANSSFTINATRRNEKQGFKLVQASSMFINEGGNCNGGFSDCHDSNAVRYIGSNLARHQVSFNGLVQPTFLFNNPSALGSTWLDILHTDDESWQSQTGANTSGNTPNMRIVLDELPAESTVTPQGRITAATNPNDDNVNVWLHDDSASSSSWSVGESDQVSYWLLAQDNPPDPWSDLGLRPGLTFLDFEGSYNCFPVRDVAQSTTAAVLPAQGYTGTALELNYDLGSANGNWAQVRCDFNPPLSLSAYDNLRFEWRGDPNSANSLQVGLIDSAGHIYARGYHHAMQRGWWGQTIVPFQFLEAWTPGTHFNPGQVSALFISVVKDPVDDSGGSGRIAIDNLGAFRIVDPAMTDTPEMRSSNRTAAQAAASWIASQQTSTGLVRSWQEEAGCVAHIYDQALALIVFVNEGMWSQANGLVSGLVNAQNADGSWPKSRNCNSLAVVHSNKWEGDIAWAIYALSRYRAMGGTHPHAASAQQKGANWLATRVSATDGCLVIDHTEATIDAWWAFHSEGVSYSDEAQKIRNCLLTYYWDNQLGRFKGGRDWWQPYLDNQTWGAEFLKASSETEKARRALNYARQVLQVPAQGGQLSGFDGQAGPWSVWNEGSAQYVAAGGEGSGELLAEVLAQQEVNGAMRGSPDEFNGGGVWTTRWHGVAPTAWLYNALCGGPFRLGSPSLCSLFEDVPATYWASAWIGRLYDAGITGGCGVNPLRYCPESSVTRAQMAVFLLRGIHGSSYSPHLVGASTGFGDVPTNYWAAAWIKQLAAEGITSGCGGGSYCPEAPVSRAQMAVFLLRSKYGSGYTPHPVGGSTGFGDVPLNYWAAAWIKQLVTEGITSGCATGSYCPESPVTRAQMAVFLVRTFNLP